MSYLALESTRACTMLNFYGVYEAQPQIKPPCLPVWAAAIRCLRMCNHGPGTRAKATILIVQSKAARQSHVSLGHLFYT